MSLLTKVFIVVLVVLSIAFTPMTISFVAQTTDWRDTAQKYEEHARVADANLRHLIAANAAELTAANDTIRGHLSEIADLEEEIAELEEELGAAAQDITRKWADLLDELVTEELHPRRTDVDVRLVALAWLPSWLVTYNDGIRTQTATIAAHLPPEDTL